MKKKSKGKGSGSGGIRKSKVRVRTARGRKISSTRWLERQLNDPYVAQAQREGYRSRAAYKLMEMDDKYHFLKKGGVVVDLGAAPGSWLQVAHKKVGGEGRIIGLDLSEIQPIPGVEIMQGDFLDQELFDALLASVGPKKIDAVLSDMAAPSCGHPQTDHLRIMALCEAAADFAIQVLRPGGAFLSKVLQGGTENQLLALLKRHFASVRHVKPGASRQDSAEMYVLATGFKG
jgi:23S rRNA (uridine2552-2'-O)-methyltransferase